MKTMTKGLVSIALLAAAFTVGCGSGSGGADSGVGGSTGAAGQGAGGTGGTGGGDVCAGITLYGISDGDSCFDVVSVAAGSQDGCMIGVADPYDAAMMTGVVGSALPINYVANTGVLTVGNMGSLGDGAIMCNQGTLLRDSMSSFSATCTFHQTDSSMVTITATNEFDITVTENQSMFATACTASDVPTGGACMSSWTWHMKKNAAKTPPGCN